MGGFFGVVSPQNCTTDLFFGTDYHSHLGTVRGGLAVRNGDQFTRSIHDITNAQFRSKFDDELKDMKGAWGIGVISDYDDQPLVVGSHLGTYAIATVGVVQNAAELAEKAFRQRAHFSEMSGSEINPTELVATLINEGDTFEQGIRNAQEQIKGSCSILLLTADGVYAARDRLGRTPVMVGRKSDGSWAAASETCAFANLDYVVDRYLGPGEVVLLSPDGIEQRQPPGDDMQVCSFLWVYYGYPSSNYEGINVEDVRNRCGAALARNDDVSVDLVAGIPDSGTAHAIGYAVQAGIAYKRPFVKYTPTWPRSFMPQDQEIRDLVARMKLIPIQELIDGQRILFCEDSIVRGTQLQDIIQRVFDYGAREVHMRPACPPLVYGCKFLNFSRSRSVMDLATRRAMKVLEDEGVEAPDPAECTDPDSELHREMVERIRQRLKLTSLKYQRLDDLVGAIGLPKSRLCTYCWDGCEGCK